MNHIVRKRPRRVSILLAGAVLVAGCGSGDDSKSEEGKGQARTQAAGQVLRLGVVTAPGEISFDKKRLQAKAGKITLEFRNGQELGHNVRIQTGKRCCFTPGSKDIGGTPTISKGTTRTTLDLEPGTYQYLCSIGGHWQRGQRGVLVVGEGQGET